VHEKIFFLKKTGLGHAATLSVSIFNQIKIYVKRNLTRAKLVFAVINESERRFYG
jgi:hypothetical protein